MSDRLAVQQNSSGGEFCLIKNLFSERKSFLEKKLAEGLQSENVVFLRKKDHGEISVGGIPSYPWDGVEMGAMRRDIAFCHLFWGELRN